MFVRIVISAFALMVFVAPSAPAVDDMLPQKRELIKDLLRVIDVRNMAAKQLDAALENLKTTTLPQMLEAGIRQQIGEEKMAELPQEKKDAAIKKYSARMVEGIRKGISEKIDIGGLTEGILFDLYGKYFDEKELQAIVDFYRSPAGSKVVSLMPQLYAEAMKASSEATNKVVVEITMKTAKEEMTALVAELFPSDCEED